MTQAIPILIVVLLAFLAFLLVRLHARADEILKNQRELIQSDRTDRELMVKILGRLNE